jgi:protein-S-isoprenylcysteine O-methyltransferase Ste14
MRVRAGIGLKDGLDALRGRPLCTAHLVLRGPYRLIRHPMYAGFLMAAWATPRLTLGHAVAAAALTAYAVAGARMEERALVSRFGRAYADYRRRTPAALPWPSWRRSPAR